MEEKRKRRKAGEGGWTRDGYIRLKTREMQHRYVWRKHHGPVPPGKQIHHKDEDKTNNAIENLELVDCLTHKRLHSNCELRGGVWFKKCMVCNMVKELSVEFWYIAPAGWPKYGRCRKCHNHLTSVEKRVRRKRRQQLAASIPQNHAISTDAPFAPTLTVSLPDPNDQPLPSGNAVQSTIPEVINPNDQPEPSLLNSILSLPGLFFDKLKKMKRESK